MEKSVKKIFKICAFAGIFIFGSEFLFSQESLDSVYAQIDLAFVEQSPENISKVLEIYSSSKDYYLYEAYTLKKARQYVVEDNLEFARDATLAVIDNNLENFDAVDLYSYIDRAILSEEAARRAEENRLRMEAERLAVLNERTKAKIAKSDSYSSVNTASGTSIYINQEKAFSSIDWNVSIGVADVLFQSVTKPDSYTSLKYGLSFGANLFYKTEEYIAGGEIFADFEMLTLGTGEQEIISTGKFVPMISFPSLNKNFFLRVGAVVQGLGAQTDVETGSVETFFSPVFGLGLFNMMLGSTAVDMYYDYYLGHFAYDDLKSSMEAGFSVMLPLTENERTRIGLKLGLVDTLFIKDEGIDNRAKGIISIGVGNVKN
ncbi:MAG: hypothetical protein PUD00_08755 [Treponema berlinense]|uniref:hypothetical protein n=1 Tax=Treponema berlinense TaxID=225004 RepID=UPI002355BB58|nr:hypothetical protein [Treponema berlinense]MCI5542116.1 hypothetical protein [Treponema berlinense]MDD5835305.1 hypothetical protein [Treponema berlinense]MDY3707502.1 hypothetical protein [Treponema berlinense]